MTTIYFAARYSRREELVGYAAEIRDDGYIVSGRWLERTTRLTEDDLISAEAQVEARRFADEDIADLNAAELVIVFTEVPRTTMSRGGRHVELGLALAWERPVYVVGPRENVFHSLADRYFETWEACKAHLLASPVRKAVNA